MKKLKTCLFCSLTCFCLKNFHLIGFSLSLISEEKQIKIFLSFLVSNFRQFFIQFSLKKILLFFGSKLTTELYGINRESFRHLCNAAKNQQHFAALVLPSHRRYCGNWEANFLVQCFYQMSPIHHLRATRSLAPHVAEQIGN